MTRAVASRKNSFLDIAFARNGGPEGSLTGPFGGRPGREPQPQIWGAAEVRQPYVADRIMRTRLVRSSRLRSPCRPGPRAHLDFGARRPGFPATPGRIRQRGVRWKERRSATWAGIPRMEFRHPLSRSCGRHATLIALPPG